MMCCAVLPLHRAIGACATSTFLFCAVLGTELACRTHRLHFCAFSRRHTSPRNTTRLYRTSQTFKPHVTIPRLKSHTLGTGAQVQRVRARQGGARGAQPLQRPEPRLCVRGHEQHRRGGEGECTGRGAQWVVGGKFFPSPMNHCQTRTHSGGGAQGGGWGGQGGGGPGFLCVRLVYGVRIVGPAGHRIRTGGLQG